MTGNRHVRFGGGRLETQVKLCAGRLPYFIALAQSRRQAEQGLTVVERTLEELKLRLEPSKTQVISFSDGFEFLGVRFDSDSYTFLWEERRITVQGDFDWLWSQHISWEY